MNNRVIVVGPNKVRVVKVGGPQGPKGDPGVSGASYLHTQTVPALVWTINHNLGTRPVVEVRDNAGNVVLASMTHTSVNLTVVSFVTAAAGSAYLTL